MPEVNRNGWVVKWLVCALWGLLITGLLFLANNVIANQNKNVDTHKEMIGVSVAEHEDIREEIQETAQELRKDFTEQVDKIDDKQEILLVQQTRILTILEGMEDDND